MTIPKIEREEGEKNMKSYQFTILRPGGNDTALIKGVIMSASERKLINDAIMKLYPTVEQVGFIETNQNAPQLMMAGGEFCGNATRSTAWKALSGNAGALDLQVSGVSQLLRAGVTTAGEAFAQMPIYADPEKVSRDGNNFIVELEGITQYINFDADEIVGLSDEQIKERAMSLIKEKNLDQYPAAGVMYTKKVDDRWQITPVVYVKSIDTLFLETACGSGTISVALALAKEIGASVIDLPIVQPTGEIICASVEYVGDEFRYAQISGEITPICEAELLVNESGSIVVEKVTKQDELNQLYQGGLITLYQDIFSQPPYLESFTANEVQQFFDEYLQEGLLFVSRDERSVVGFGAAMPMNKVSSVVEVLRANEVNTQNMWYMADLGVAASLRRNGIGKKLVEARLQKMPQGSIAVMRTSIENLPSQTLYRSLGFETLPNVRQFVEGTRIDGESYSDERLFMYKQL